MGTEILRENKNDIVALYNNGLTHQEIANLYDTSKSSVARFCRSIGITSKVAISIDDEYEIVNLYNSGIIMKDIAKQFNVGERRVSNVLHKHGVKIVQSYERLTKYSLNEHYFDNIDNQDKAYILGLLYADGSNSNGHITISLQERDVEILYKINSLIESDRPLKFLDYNTKNPNCQNQYRLDVANQYMAGVLNTQGMVSNKSLLLQFPEWLDESLYPHFIRGYFDGDGYVSKNYCNAKLSIVSTADFCNKIAEIVKDKLDVNTGIYLCHKNNMVPTRTLQISGRRQISKFLNYIYKDANLFLQRKYDIYKSLYFEYK